MTAGHLAVLAERAATGPLDVILFDGVTGAGWSWSQRDEAMARRLLAGSPVSARTLAVAGNARTPTSLTDLGVPLGACLARQRPGIREIRIRYGGGRFWNARSCQFARRASAQDPIRLYQETGELVLDLPMATEAVVPQRPQPSPPPMRKSPAYHADASVHLQGSMHELRPGRPGLWCRNGICQAASDAKGS
jgi:hypothetical protein